MHRGIRWLIIGFPLILLVLYAIRVVGYAPPLDAMIIYRTATQYYEGGLGEALRFGLPIHTPLLYLATGIAFLVAGKTPVAYTLLGLIMAAASMILVYRIVRRAWSSDVAALTVLLLFGNPLVLVNVLYPTFELLMLLLLLLSADAFLTRNNRLLALSLALLVLTKETGIVFVGCFGLFALASAGQGPWMKKIIPFLPAATVFVLWMGLVRVFGATEYREIASDGTAQNALLMAIRTAGSGKFLNYVLARNMFNTFILNLQWPLTALALTALFLPWMPKDALRSQGARKTLGVLVITCAVYVVTVLSFPTWTIPRYGIPALAAPALLAALVLTALPKKWFAAVVLTILLSVPLRASYSLDPVSGLFGRTGVLGQQLYSINDAYGGDDSLLYNMQFLWPVLRQNRAILQASYSNADVLVSDCQLFKMAERVESMGIHPDMYAPYALTKPMRCVSRIDMAYGNDPNATDGETIFLDHGPDQSYVVTSPAELSAADLGL